MPCLSSGWRASLRNRLSQATALTGTPSVTAGARIREYTTKRVERRAPRVVTHERVVNHTKVVRGNTKLIQENRLIVHVRPVINREVVVHRTNTIVKTCCCIR